MSAKHFFSISLFAAAAWRRCRLAWAIAVLCAWPIAQAEPLPSYVDLRANQTMPIRNQGSRTTCITFAAIAALEATYRRAGYGSLDLSEQFTNHMGKTFWLHPYWPDVVARGPDGAETQVGAFGGGGGVEFLALLADGFKVPAESAMPYLDREYTPADDKTMMFPFYHAYWTKQRHMSDFNLDARFLPLTALKSDRYYSVNAYRKIDARSAAAIESALAARREVVWDFSVARVGTAADPIWRPCAPGAAACPSGAHAMLLVGYDRRSPDPRQHYFIAKNSWGASGYTGSDGFTYISYDYLQYGIAAAYIEGVNRPQTWPELGFVGRWSLSFDGWKGSLDIYHLPGLARAPWAFFGITDTDLRIGSFYDVSGTPFRVNGAVSGNSIDFRIDGSNPDAKWDVLDGRRFDYSMVKTSWGEIMAGMHTDGDGRSYGGYAKKNGFLPSGTPAPRPLRAASYMGANWSASFDNMQGNFRFDSIDRLATTATMTVLAGTFTQGATSFAASASVPNADPNSISLRVRSGPAAGRDLQGRFLHWEQGVVAGHVFVDGARSGFVMVRQ